MKKISKLLLYLTTFAILLNTINFNFVYAEDNNKYKSTYEEMEILNLLDIIPKYDEYNLDVNKIVSRADFVSSLAHIIDVRTYDGEGIFYYDVPDNYWAYNEISGLTERKIIKGSGNKKFRPDDPIKEYEAYKMVLNLLGYEKALQNYGEYPYNCIALAKKTGISSGVHVKGNLTIKDMFRILYNTIRTEVAETVGFLGNDVEYKEEKGRTLLYIYRDIGYKKGVVEGAEGVTINGSTLNENEVLVSSDIYSADINMMNYLGEKIEFFYQHNKKDDEKNIIYAKSLDNKNSLTVKVNNDASFDKTNFSLTYYDDEIDKEQKIELDRGITVIYNGGLSNKNISNIFSKDKYNAKFIENEMGQYYLAIVESYENIVADTIFESTYTVYDKFNPAKKINLDKKNYKNLHISMAGKENATFEDIKPGNVLSCYLSENKKYLKVNIVNEQESGVIKSIRNKKNGCYLLLNDKEYYLNNKTKTNTFSVGDSVTLYLDKNSEIAYIELNSKDSDIVYLIANSDKKFSENTKFKVLSKDGKIELIECADKVNVDGSIIKNQNDIFKYFRNENNFVHQIAMIDINGEGKIKAIDTTTFCPDKGESNNSLMVSVPYKENQLYSNDGMVGRKSVIDKKTIIFATPAANKYDNDDSDFYVLNKSRISQDEHLNIETYKTKDKTGYEEYAVLRNYNTPSKRLPVMVEDIVNGYNSKNEIVECLHGMLGNQEIYYAAESSQPDMFSKAKINPGSIVRIGFNKDGDVHSIKHLYSVTDPGIYGSNEGGDYNWGYFIKKGFVNDIVDGILKIGYDDPAKVDQILLTKGIPVLVYDKNNKREPVDVATFADMETYYNVGDKCSKVVVITFARSVVAIFEYK